MNAGGSLRNLKSHNYQLLFAGRSLFWGYWWFYGGNQAQSDLNNPNRQVVVGDAYGYIISTQPLFWCIYTV
jgi:hypothetical protein